MLDMAETSFDEAAWRERMENFRREKEAFLLESPDSPITDVADDLPALAWFPLEPSFRVVSRYQPATTREEVSLATTSGPDRSYERVATFGFTLDDAHHVLTGYRAPGQATIFVPFADGTAGASTPETGRYLDVDPRDAGVGDDVVLEFNLAQLPFAAYSDRYASTLPPRENRLDVAVAAGERSPERKRRKPE